MTGRMTAGRTGSRQPPRIVREPGTTVHAQIEDWLAGQIAAGALVPGDRLPTEQDLAAWFGVSRRRCGTRWPNWPGVAW